ncbi:LOG family protein, partial [Listeria monocytogenes]|nr:LOG family protein [Listeria monocytogenes]
NQDLPFPVILTGPRSAEAYLQQLHEFVGATLGHAAQRHYRIVIDDPAEVAKQMAQGLKEVKRGIQVHQEGRPRTRPAQPG